MKQPKYPDKEKYEKATYYDSGTAKILYLNEFIRLNTGEKTYIEKKNIEEYLSYEYAKSGSLPYFKSTAKKNSNASSNGFSKNTLGKFYKILASLGLIENKNNKVKCINTLSDDEIRILIIALIYSRFLNKDQALCISKKLFENFGTGEIKLKFKNLLKINDKENIAKRKHFLTKLNLIDQAINNANYLEIKKDTNPYPEYIKPLKIVSANDYVYVCCYSYTSLIETNEPISTRRVDKIDSIKELDSFDFNQIISTKSDYIKKILKQQKHFYDNNVYPTDSDYRLFFERHKDMLTTKTRLIDIEYKNDLSVDIKNSFRVIDEKESNKKGFNVAKIDATPDSIINFICTYCSINKSVIKITNDVKDVKCLLGKNIKTMSLIEKMLNRVITKIAIEYLCNDYEEKQEYLNLHINYLKKYNRFPNLLIELERYKENIEKKVAYSQDSGNE